MFCNFGTIQLPMISSTQRKKKNASKYKKNKKKLPKQKGGGEIWDTLYNLTFDASLECLWHLQVQLHRRALIDHRVEAFSKEEKNWFIIKLITLATLFNPRPTARAPPL